MKGNKMTKIRHPGKTKRDHKSGAHARCILNKQIRANWQNDNHRPPFSTIAYTCNGKRNRYANADTI